MITPGTARDLMAIVRRVIIRENQSDDESIYWPEERRDWERTIARAEVQMKGER